MLLALRARLVATSPLSSSSEAYLANSYVLAPVAKSSPGESLFSNADTGHYKDLPVDNVRIDFDAHSG